MITLDLHNCLQPKINRPHGLSQKELLLALQKNQNIKTQVLKNKKLGFLELPFQSSAHIEILEKEGRDIRQKFKNIIIIGIGGSSLGARALLNLCSPNTLGSRIFFADNPESEYVDFLIQSLDLTQTLLLVISKSGDTIESLAIFSILYKKMIEKMGLKAKKNVITITEENDGTLFQITKKEKFKTYPVPKNIGGRFSVLSNVGLLPAAIAGIDLKKLLKGAQNAESETAYILAILQYLIFKKKKELTVLFGYGRNLEGISDWYIQLLAESIGKNEKVGPTPLKAIGAIDQHSQLQLFMEGMNNKFFIFLQCLEAKKIPIPDIFSKYKACQYLKNHDLHELLLTEKRASAEALATKNRPNITLTIPKISPESVGEILFLLELQIAYLGELFKINAFDQPGVELGKKLTKTYLSPLLKNHA